MNYLYPQPSSKSWFFLRSASYEITKQYQHRKTFLCVVDLRESAATDVAKLKRQLFATHGKRRSTSELRYISLYRQIEITGSDEGSVTLFRVTLEHLVEHLREFVLCPSSSPGQPDLWGSGSNYVDIHFVDK